MISTRQMGTYNAVAAWVNANMVDDIEGPTVKEIADALGISPKTVYPIVRMPGFFKTQRPAIQPYGYGYNPAEALITSNDEHYTNGKPKPIRNTSTKISGAYDTFAGRLEIAGASNEQLSAVVDNVVEFCLSTGQLNPKVNELITLTNAARARAVRFTNGDSTALNSEADRLWLISLGVLLTACRKVLEMGITILESEAIELPDYWRLLIKE